MTALQSIRKHCLQCTCGSHSEIKACSVLKCALWEYRFGFGKHSEKSKNNPFLNKENFKILKPNITAERAIKEINRMCILKNRSS